MATPTRVEDSPHRVLVYRVEAQLVEVVGDFLSDALAEGGAAVIIATAAHLRALDEWVHICAADVETTAAELRYHRLAIDDIAASIGRDCDPAGVLQDKLQETLRQIPREVAPVHIFCELGAALWERGEVTAALDLESMSNSLRVMQPVSVLCAYPESALAGMAEMERACREHTAVVEAPSFPDAPAEANASTVSAAVLPPAPAACRTARQLVRAAFARDGRATATDAAELVLAELAANAVLHACSTFTAEVSFCNGAAHLAVTDAAPLPSGWTGFPVARDHGLGLVAALANDWAVQPLKGGKIVWADVTRGEI